MPAGVLFVHNQFPGQFRHLAESLVARGVPCAAISGEAAPGLETVRTARCAPSRGPTAGVFPLAILPETDLIRAQAALKGASALKAEGFDPAVIVGHTGWGETALLKQLFPAARQALYPEIFPQPNAAPFDAEFQAAGLPAMLQAKAKAAVTALALCDADAIVCPTPYQASTLPDVFQPRVRIIHEGVDVEALTPGPGETFTLPGVEVTVRPGDPVITHINNHLEPARGLHILARALPKVLAAVPEARVLILGQERQGSGYTGYSLDGLTWKTRALEGVDLDPSRVHFLGWVPPASMHKVLRVSTAHVYYSYPFALSWSLIDAMALGCHVIASDTAPLHDVIEDGENGRLLPFFDVDALSDALIAACRHPERAEPLRAGARRTAVTQFNRRESLAAWTALLRELGLKVPD